MLSLQVNGSSSALAPHRGVERAREAHVVADHPPVAARPTCLSCSHTLSARNPREFCMP